MSNKIDLQSLPTSLKEARSVGSKHYFTGKPCKRGHISARLTSSKSCTACAREVHVKKYKEKHPDKVKNRLNNWKKKNKDHIKDYNHNWLLENRDHKSNYNREYYLSNKGKIHSKNAERKALKKKATPKWIDREEVEYIYNLASEKQLEVDHIVPIQSDYVCGLHCADNLRCISAKLNYYKGNRYWPDMPEELIKEVFE